MGSTKTNFPVVGIGASAGGVESLQALFNGLPPDSGMGFVIVSHLGRGQRSLLAEIIMPIDIFMSSLAEDRGGNDYPAEGLHALFVIPIGHQFVPADTAASD